MAIKPKHRPQAGLNQVLEMLRPQDPVPLDSTGVSVVAIRGYFMRTMGNPNKNDRGVYDDAFFVISPSCFAAYNGNTDPSSYRKGIAALESPQVIDYIKGWHGYNSKYGHPAFRQASNVVVVRDSGTGNGKSLGNGRFTDKGTNRFWCNLHRGGWGTTSSAGCLTIYPDQWASLYNLVCDQLKQFNQKKFTVHLISDPRLL